MGKETESRRVRGFTQASRAWYFRAAHPGGREDFTIGAYYVEPDDGCEYEFGIRMKKGTFATHYPCGSAFKALCRTVRRSGPLHTSILPTCRRCRFYLLAPTLGREGALARMKQQDAAARPTPDNGGDRR